MHPAQAAMRPPQETLHPLRHPCNPKVSMRSEAAVHPPQPCRHSGGKQPHMRPQPLPILSTLKSFPSPMPAGPALASWSLCFLEPLLAGAFASRSHLLSEALAPTSTCFPQHHCNAPRTETTSVCLPICPVSAAECSNPHRRPQTPFPGACVPSPTLLPLALRPLQAVPRPPRPPPAPACAPNSLALPLWWLAVDACGCTVAASAARPPRAGA
eukprot:365086-Chlamydomonas_euryale.AAC.6